jgi:Putative MetA-pathway of phenol degradation
LGQPEGWPCRESIILRVIFGALLLLAALASPRPAASPTPAPGTDPCGGAHTAILSAINRPTVGFSPCAVKPHDVLAEGGYTNQIGGQPESIYPQGFIRYGVIPNLEFDVDAPSGKFDTGVGAKYELWHNAVSAFGVDLLYGLPTGARGFTNGAPTETANLDFSTSISSKFGVATTVGVSSFPGQTLDGATQRTTTVLPSVVLTDTFNARTQLYAETFSSTHIRPDGGTLFGLDGGVQYLLTPRVEVDAEMGRILNGAVASHSVGFGVGLLF